MLEKSTKVGSSARLHAARGRAEGRPLGRGSALIIEDGDHVYAGVFVTVSLGRLREFS